MSSAHAPVRVRGEVVTSRSAGAYRHLTVAAHGIPERFRAGNFVAVSVPGLALPRMLWIHRVRGSSAYGPMLEVVVERDGPGSSWLCDAPVGTAVEVTGPLGRPFAIPRTPAHCLLVGEERAAAPLFPLAERLRERGSSVSLVVAARDEPRLLPTLDSRRWVRSVTVMTVDGSVGQRGDVAEEAGALVGRSDADVVYASASRRTLAAVAQAAEATGLWSQVAVEEPMPCGTGLCHGCALPVVGEDGVARVVRACAEGPVVRGDRVRWDAW